MNIHQSSRVFETPTHIILSYNIFTFLSVCTYNLRVVFAWKKITIPLEVLVSTYHVMWCVCIKNIILFIKVGIIFDNIEFKCLKRVVHMNNLVPTHFSILSYAGSTFFKLGPTSSIRRHIIDNLKL